MFKNQGIAVDAFVSFSTDCEVKAQAFRDEIQLELGHSAGCLHIVTDAPGLRKLVTVARQLQDRVDAADPTALDITIPSPVESR